MKRIFSYILIFAIVFALSFVYAGDKYVTVPSIKNHLGGMTLKVTFPGNSDSTGSQHTDAIFIGNVNDADAYFKVIANAASDINVIIHFSNDLTTWKAVAAATIDAISNTAEYDTLGGRVLTDFHKYSWMVIESDGQAGVNITDILYLEGNFQADVKQPTSSGQALRHSFDVTTNVTDP